jgi:hypothetical protein
MKNSSFAGTDFTYEDMEAVNYSAKYSPAWGRPAAPCRPAPRARIRLVPARCGPEGQLRAVTVEYYDRQNQRRLTSSGVERIKGYWVALEREMHDLSSNHRTRMVLTNLRFDSGLGDELFTTRYLER